MKKRSTSLVAIFFALAVVSVSGAADPLLVSTSVELVSSRADKLPIPAQRWLVNDKDRGLDKTQVDRMTAFEAAREVYVWAWPLVYMSNLRRSLHMVRGPGVSGGAPVAPVNSLCMLTDVVAADFRSVPCPNRDVIYGFGMMDLGRDAVVIQVPDFGKRFWLYQVGDHRMESFAQLGQMYGTRPGFYLIVGPQWQGHVPEGITKVFRSPTNLAYILPRVFSSVTERQSATAAELKLPLSQVVMYPLSAFHGHTRHLDWHKPRWYPSIGTSSRARSKLVQPERFFDDLELALAELPLRSEEATLAEIARSLISKAQQDSQFADELRQLATQIESQTIEPMFDFAQSSELLPSHWRSTSKGAAFGDDYWTRTATAKSNPFVNREHEAKYYYLEHSQDGRALTGGDSYKIKFHAEAMPPTRHFWSLTLYDTEHQLVKNSWGRYSVGNLSKDLKFNDDGSLTINISPESTRANPPENWLPSPVDGKFVLYLRIYAPEDTALSGQWTPPAAEAVAETVHAYSSK